MSTAEGRRARPQDRRTGTPLAPPLLVTMRRDAWVGRTGPEKLGTDFFVLGPVLGVPRRRDPAVPMTAAGVGGSTAAERRQRCGRYPRPPLNLAGPPCSPAPPRWSGRLPAPDPPQRGTSGLSLLRRERSVERHLSPGRWSSPRRVRESQRTGSRERSLTVDRSGNKCVFTLVMRCRLEGGRSRNLRGRE